MDSSGLSDGSIKWWWGGGFLRSAIDLVHGFVSLASTHSVDFVGKANIVTVNFVRVYANNGAWKTMSRCIYGAVEIDPPYFLCISTICFV